MSNQAQKQRERQRDLTIAIANLEFDDATIKAATPDLLEAFARIERGEATHEEEVNRVFAEARNKKTRS